MAKQRPSPRAHDPRPASAVSSGVGLAGLAGLAVWFGVARWFGMDGPLAALVGVVACGVPMVGWSLAVDRVHRHASTGIAWDRPRAWSETFDVSLVKLTGLWATWGLIAAFYCVGRWYWDGQYLLAMHFMMWGAPVLLAASIPYMFWIDRRLIEPRDGAWAFGVWLLGNEAANGGAPDRAVLEEHFRSWAVKGFFTAFMISIVPGNWREVIAAPAFATLAADPVALSRWLIAAMFLLDVAFATVGYLLTMRPLDAHIRSANPYVAGWTAALLCYPPFGMMGAGQPFDYHPGTQEWSAWLAGQPVALALVGAALVGLTGFYAWATVAFGLRFSNLTHRGILTHGPYALTKHPAYLAKNAFWWIATLPFLAASGSFSDMVRNTVLLGAVSGVYYWRARTEERHLSADPAYRAYAEWMERNAPIPRAIRWLAGTKARETVAAE